MNKGILAVLAAGTLALSGCFFGGSDPEGQFTLTWSILVDGSPGTCAQVNAVTIEVISKHGSGETFVDRFACADMGGRTDPVPAGNYTVEVRLLDGAGTQLNLVDQIDLFTLHDGEVVNIGQYPFSFELAKATFRAVMGNGTASNCGSTATNGAGVAVQEVRVFAASGEVCLPFSLSTNDDTVATCSTYVCYERNVTHTIHGLSNGAYDVQIIGYKGATGPDPYPCYVSNEIAMDISGGQSTNLGDIVAPFTSALDSRCDATKPEAGTGT